MKTQIPQDRWECGHCGADGWWTPSTHVGRPPTTHHNRPDGRRCIAALPADDVMELALRNSMPRSGC